MTKRRLIPLLAGAVLIAGMVVIRAQESELPHPDTQKLIIENMLVRVYDVHVPPGVAEPRHSHGRGVTVALSDYDNETKSYPDGKINRGHNKFGDVRWAEPVTHEAKNIGPTEQQWCGSS